MTWVNLAGTAASIAGQGLNVRESPNFLLQICGTVVWLLPWQLLRRRTWRWSWSQLRVLEVTMLLLASVLSGLQGRLLLPETAGKLLENAADLRMPELLAVAMYGRLYVSMTISLGIAMIVIGRAGLVPSKPRYTALLTAACFLSVTICLTIPSLPLDPPGLMSVTLPPPITGFIAINLLVWGGLVTAVSTALSATVYGLHRAVNRARRMGQYELEDKLGEGGMGVVYRASHAMMRRPTAVKLLLPGRDRALDLARFEREVQQTARLSHPNTITIYDYGRTQDGVFYYSMELLQGATLQRVVTDTGALPANRVLHILRGLAGALSEAHAIALIHRDIKPANIFLAEQGGLSDTPKLLDFGLVKQLNQEENSPLTQTHALAGTPLYMAPESITDPKTVDGRSDLYALGAVAYYMLSGRSVFEGKTPVVVCSHHLHTIPEPITVHAPDTPAELAKLVMTCLAKSPQDRPQTADDLLTQLNACPQSHTWKAAQANTWWAEHADLADTSLGSESQQGASSQSQKLPADTLVADLSGRSNFGRQDLNDRA